MYLGGRLWGKVQRGYTSITAPLLLQEERPGVSHCIHLYPHPLELACVRECQKEIPKTPEQAGGGWLGTEAHQDSRMGRTQLGQLSHPPGDKGTPIQREMGHLWPKHKGN